MGLVLGRHYTRLEPDASVILIQTRWHEDDLAGRLIKQMSDDGDEWEIVNLPALAEFLSEVGLAKSSNARRRVCVGPAGTIWPLACAAKPITPNWKTPRRFQSETLENILLKRQIGLPVTRALAEAGYGAADVSDMSPESAAA